MQLVIAVLLSISLSYVKGQTTQPPNYSCYENRSNIEFTFINSFHSAWNLSSNCSVEQCSVTTNNNSCLLPSTPCFEYRTVSNSSYCAPAILCSILEACNNITNTCASNTSICVINSCCLSQAVCLPLAVTNFCQTVSPTTTYETTTPSSSFPTTTTSPSVTTVLPINPCSSGMYWSLTGTMVAGTGSSGSGLNQLSHIGGIYLDSNDTLYISDHDNARIMKYLYGASSGSVVAGVTGLPGNGLNQLAFSINSLYLDSNQNLYISDGSNNRVMRWSNGASVGVIVAGNGSSGSSLNQLSTPYGLWLDSSSNLFIAELFNHRVTKWTLGASSSVLIAGVTGSPGNTSDRLNLPTGLFYDEPNQNLYIANAGAYTVMRWHVGDSNGTVIAGVPGVNGSNSNLLSYIEGITLDQWKNLYVADRVNGRIQLFCNGNSTGITIAGSGSGGASLLYPFDVKLDSQMNLYISEYDGYCVTKFAKL